MAEGLCVRRPFRPLTGILSDIRKAGAFEMLDTFEISRILQAKGAHARFLRKLAAARVKNRARNPHSMAGSNPTVARFAPHSRICGTTNNKMSWMTWNGVVAKPDTRRPSATDTMAMVMQVNTTSPTLPSLGKPMNVSATHRMMVDRRQARSRRPACSRRGSARLSLAWRESASWCRPCAR